MMNKIKLGICVYSELKIYFAYCNFFIKQLLDYTIKHFFICVKWTYILDETQIEIWIPLILLNIEKCNLTYYYVTLFHYYNKKYGTKENMIKHVFQKVEFISKVIYSIPPSLTSNIF